ncbi:hypothetical protein H072_7361 [Dactylellina haptotyla CBS 200.50]|uniref:F-box domain-containing protein n=1 Tax=Dactylellina haptotyla (strain CBS 200.50) TaxID=1284197 RepID=S8BHX2_DACHA|nr:hypothetical protein H072_7361 [Dactylellina haptotyla CBS 200.50]
MTTPYLPLELQDMILEAADWSQHPTLKRVCRYWRTRVMTRMIKRYQPLGLSDQETITRCFGTDYTTVTKDAAPFLVHKAICEFTGDLGERVQDFGSWQRFERNISYRKSLRASGYGWTEFRDDFPLVAPEAKSLMEYQDDPVFLSDDTYELPDPLPYPIRLGWGFPKPEVMNQGRTRACSFAASCGRQPLGTHNTMKVKEFIGLFFEHYGFPMRTLRMAAGPQSRVQLRSFIQHVGLWSPESLENLPPGQREEIKFLDVRFVHKDLEISD